MLKHVQISPMRGGGSRCDTMSIRSSISSSSASSSSCASSMCGSPEPEQHLASVAAAAAATAATTVSSASAAASAAASATSAACLRVASSCSSLTEVVQPQTTIKIFTACLRIDIEYKTLGISWNCSSKEVVGQLLRRCKIRQRDPRLFYLCMNIAVRRSTVQTLLILDDDASPALLQACYPAGDTQFYLQMRPGGLVRVQTAILQPSSQYKSVLIAEETTTDELLQLLLSSYRCAGPVERYSVYEVSPDQEYQRKLHPDDQPLRVQRQRTRSQFMVRENAQYLEAKAASGVEEELAASAEAEAATSTTSSSCTSSTSVPSATSTSSLSNLCGLCKYSFKSCEFCGKNKPPAKPSGCGSGGAGSRSAMLGYSPVYNIREIRCQRQSLGVASPTDRKRFQFGPYPLTRQLDGEEVVI